VLSFPIATAYYTISWVHDSRFT